VETVERSSVLESLWRGNSLGTTRWCGRTLRFRCWGTRRDGSYLKNQPMRYTTSSEPTVNWSRCVLALGGTVKRRRAPATGTNCSSQQWQPLARAGVGAWLKGSAYTMQRFAPKTFPRACSNERRSNRVAAQAPLGDRRMHPRSPRRTTRVSSRLFCHVQRTPRQDVAALLLPYGYCRAHPSTSQNSGRPIYSVDVSGSEQQALFLARVGAFGPREAPAKVWRETCRDARESNVDTLPQQMYTQLNRR